MINYYHLLKFAPFIVWGWLLHRVGDFLLQTSWMALNKHARWYPAVVHGLVYTVPFLLITLDWWRLAAIAISHILIDHYRIAAWWARLINWEWRKPQPVIPAWCIVEIDQVLHVLINSAILVL